MSTQTTRRESALAALTIALAIGLIFAGISLFAILGSVNANTARVAALERQNGITQGQLRQTETALASSEQRQLIQQKKLADQKRYSVVLARQVQSLGAKPVAFFTVVRSANQQPAAHPSSTPRKSSTSTPKHGSAPTPTPTPTSTCIALGLICH